MKSYGIILTLLILGYLNGRDTTIALIFYDTFTYSSIADMTHNSEWYIRHRTRDSRPGPVGSHWDKKMVSIWHVPDECYGGNCLKLSLSTRGTANSTYQAEVEWPKSTKKMVFYGIYMFRIKITNSPQLHHDVTVQSVFLINSSSKPYEEIDFEYLAWDGENGLFPHPLKWEGAGSYITTWYSVNPKRKNTNHCSMALNEAEWYEVIFWVTEDFIYYWIIPDNNNFFEQLISLGGCQFIVHTSNVKNPLYIVFNHWLDEASDGREFRNYNFFVDYVLYVSDIVLAYFVDPNFITDMGLRQKLEEIKNELQDATTSRIDEYEIDIETYRRIHSQIKLNPSINILTEILSLLNMAN